MDKLKFYNMQHVAADDLRQVYLDTESALENYIKDFYSTDTQFVLSTTVYSTGSLLTHQTGSASLDVETNAGVGYVDYKRIELTDIETTTVTNIPSDQGGNFTVTRIDLIYLEKIETDAQPFAIDFIDADRNIYQETKNTRELDSYEIKILQGTYSIGGGSKPDTLPHTLPLTYIHLRDATSKIYNIDTGSLGEGFVEDCRNLVAT